MKTIKCPVCDEEILIVPSLPHMKVAIRNHIKKHRGHGIRNIQVCMKIRSSLVHQVLEKVAKMRERNNS